MTANTKRFIDAKTFCWSQHSTQVIWDTQEKYLDLKYIAGREGEDRSAYTGLHNPNSSVCNSTPECDGKLVTINQASFNK